LNTHLVVIDSVYIALHWYQTNAILTAKKTKENKTKSKSKLTTTTATTIKSRMNTFDEIKEHNTNTDTDTDSDVTPPSTPPHTTPSFFSSTPTSIEQHLFALDLLDSKLTAIFNKYFTENGCILKLNTISGVDALQYGYQPKVFKSLLREHMECLTEQQTRDVNTENMAYLQAMAQMMRLKNPKDAVLVNFFSHTNRYVRKVI
jgi:hypothetical protein